MENSQENIDNFKDVYKYYKSKQIELDSSLLYDFDNDISYHTDVEQHIPQNLSTEYDKLRYHLNLKAVDEWQIYLIQKHPGLFVVRNVFTPEAALQWASLCLQHFHTHPHTNNLSNLDTDNCKSNWWNESKECLLTGIVNKRASQLRWATMGYHHNWDTKEYANAAQSSIPSPMNDLCQIVLKVIDSTLSQAGCSSHNTTFDLAKLFEAQAAIVNYYPRGATLGPHTDHSEPAKDAPLLSISLGLSAVFLIGGCDRSVRPSALLLRHGDIVVMAGQARRAVHAVPRIVGEFDTLKNGTSMQDTSGHYDKDSVELSKERKMSMEREKFTRQQQNSTDRKGGTLSEKKIICQNIDRSAEPLQSFLQHWNGKLNQDELKSVEVNNKGEEIIFFAAELLKDSNRSDLEATLSYLQNFRINMNIRQVKLLS